MCPSDEASLSLSGLTGSGRTNRPMWPLNAEELDDEELDDKELEEDSVPESSLPAQMRTDTHE